MTDAHDRVTVLGLGRMGAAMATRLHDHGWDVLTWNRTPTDAPAGVEVSTDAADAVSGAGLVLLCLYDGAACDAVLDRCAGDLRPGALVVNTSTVGPEEAAALGRRVEQAGARYVHAPVMGSTPAVRAGTLLVLAGGAGADVDEARPVLAPLSREVRHVGDPADAAALKLIANACLAGAVVGLRDVLAAAAAMGLDVEAVLDVVVESPLGVLAKGKRERLADPGLDRPSEFAVGALLKDVRLLADASGTGSYAARTLGRLVDGRAVDPDADIAAAIVAPAADPGPADGADVPDDVAAPLAAYAQGHATGDPRHFREAFLPTAHVEGRRDGVFTSWGLDDYCALFDGSPAADEEQRRRTVDRVDVTGSVASATMTLEHGPDVFTDVFLLVRTPDGWRIANKVYHRHGADDG